jgi:hypothetical protein
MASNLILHPDYAQPAESRALAQHKTAMLIRILSPWSGLQDRIEYMPVNRKVTSSLAWVGLLLIIGVPSADFVTAQMTSASPDTINAAMVGMGTTPPISAPTEATDVAAVTPVVQPETAPAADAVDQLLAEGRDLPAYITEAAPEAAVEVASVPVEEVVSEPAPVVAETAPPVVPVEEPAPAVETASVAPPVEEVVPAVQSASIRPPVEQAAPIVETAAVPPVTEQVDPVETAAISPAVTDGPRVIIHEPTEQVQTVATLANVEVPPELPAVTEIVAPEPMPLSMRPASIERSSIQTLPDQRTSVATNADVLLPPADVLDGRNTTPGGNRNPRSDVITAEELEDWESGPLSEYLEQQRRGEYAASSYRDEDEFGPGEYVGNSDSDGFFYDEGPDRRDRDRRKSRANYQQDGFRFFIN